MVAQLDLETAVESLLRPVEHRRRRIESYSFRIWIAGLDQGQEPSVPGAEVNAPLDLLWEGCQQHLLCDLPMRYLPREVLGNPRLISPFASHAMNAMRAASILSAHRRCASGALETGS